MTQNNNLHEVEDPDKEYYEPKTDGEKSYWKRHLVNKHKDRNGNGSDVFSATNVGKDKSRLKGDPKADLDDPIIGNRPIDQLKGELGTKKLKEDKMTSAEKTKRESIVKAMKSKTSGFKERYGDRWKDVMYATATKQAMGEDFEEVSEDSQAATSDNPGMGGGQGPATGTVDNNNSHLNNNPTGDPPRKGDVKDTLEKIAMQAAELHDKLEDGQEIDSQAQSLLNDAKDAIDQVYEMVTNGNAAPQAGQAAPVKKGGASANVKEDFDDVDDSEELFEDVEDLEEATVKDSTGTIVGVHKPGIGFKPNTLGKKLGHKAHPTDVPAGTMITKRGRKVGSKSFGASKRKDISHDEEGTQDTATFTDHLLKAANHRDGGHIQFSNGQTHHISKAHANHALAIFARPGFEKPDTKETLRKHLSSSKENFHKVISTGKLLPIKAKVDQDAKIKAKTSKVLKAPGSSSRAALAQKILARRKAGK